MTSPPDWLAGVFGGKSFEAMSELCETCRQPLCPWEVQQCEVCLLNERNEREEVKDRDEKANGQTPQAQRAGGDVRGQTPARGGAVD